MQQSPRLQARDVVPDRDRIFVFVRGSVDDSINHWPMLIGKVRAWLKYLLDKLFDQEGSKRSRSRRKRSSRESPSKPFAADAAPGSGYVSSRRSKLRNIAKASRIACESSGRCRGSF